MNCRNSIEHYTLFIKTNSLENFKEDTKVLFEGKQVGYLSAQYVSDSMRILSVNIKSGTRIPANSNVKYEEGLLGDNLLIFISPFQIKVKGYYWPGDTVILNFIKKPKKLDSTKVNKLFKDLKNVLDSNLK